MLSFFKFIGLIPYFPNYAIMTFLLIALRIILLSKNIFELVFDIILLKALPSFLITFVDWKEILLKTIEILIEIDVIRIGKNLHGICAFLTRNKSSKSQKNIKFFMKIAWIFIILTSTSLIHIIDVKKVTFNKIINGFYFLSHHLRYFHYFIVLYERNNCLRRKLTENIEEWRQKILIIDFKSVTKSINQAFNATLLILLMEQMLNFIGLLTVCLNDDSGPPKLKVLLTSILDLSLTSSFILLIVAENCNQSYQCKLMLFNILSKNRNYCNNDVITRNCRINFYLEEIWPTERTLLEKLQKFLFYLNSITFVFMYFLILEEKKKNYDPFKDYDIIDKLFEDLESLLNGLGDSL